MATIWVSRLAQHGAAETYLANKLSASYLKRLRSSGSLKDCVYVCVGENCDASVPFGPHLFFKTYAMCAKLCFILYFDVSESLKTPTQHVSKEVGC